MTSPDDEFDDFLRRRRPVFRNDDDLEPPAELDRLVLRRARDAIEGERPQRVFRAPSWGMPVALAATLVLGFTIFLRVGTGDVTKSPEVTVQKVSRQVEMAPAAAPAASPAEAPAMSDQANANDGGAVVVEIGAGSTRAEADQAAEVIVDPAAEARARRLDKVADAAQPARDSAPGATERYAPAAAAAAPASSAPAAASKPEYRRDTKSWLAEIERLRAAGDDARADAELAEYKREHRAYAASPDR